MPGLPSNADVTAAAMQAMPEHGGGRQAASPTCASTSGPTAASLSAASGGVNSQSTAWAVEGMIAVGADPAKIASGANSALDYLAARQAGDGHYRYSASSDQTPVWVTGEVLVATAGEALPISPPPREKKVTTVAPSKTVPPPPGIGSGAPAPAEPLPESKDGGIEESGAAVPPAAVPGSPPATSGAVPVPGETGGALPPEAEASQRNRPRPPPEPITASGSAPSPAVPIGIGLLATALAIGIPWWLGRRYAW